VLAGGQNGAAWLLRAEGGAVTQVGPGWTFPTRAALDAVAWNADESLAAFGNQAGEVYLVRPEGGQLPVRLSAHRDIVTGLAFNRDGVLVSGGRDGLIRFWRPDGASYRAGLTLRAPGPVAALAFTPDGDDLGVLLEGEFAVRLWRLGRLRDKLTAAGLGAD
jgi:WD40 repeat protein